MSPRIATRRRPPARETRYSSAARIETGFALYASLISKPPPGSSRSSPRQREKSTSTLCGRGRAADAHDLDVVAGDRKVLRHDRGSAARQRLDQLALRAHDAVERLDQ